MEKWRVLGVVAGLCVVLGACDSSPPPVVTESPTGPATVSPTPSLTASPSPSPTVLTSAELLALLPANAGEADVEGAVVTAEFFVELLGQIYSTQDSIVWAALSTPACAYCALKVDEVAELAASGWIADGGTVVVDSDEVRGALDDDGYTYVKLPAEISDLYVTSDSGVREVAEPASVVDFGLQMELVDDVWRVNALTIEDR